MSLGSGFRHRAQCLSLLPSTLDLPPQPPGLSRSCSTLAPEPGLPVFNNDKLIPTGSSRAILLSQSHSATSFKVRGSPARCTAGLWGLSFPSLPPCPGTIWHTLLSSCCCRHRKPMKVGIQRQPCNRPASSLPSAPVNCGASVGSGRKEAERESPAAPDALRWFPWPPGAHQSGLQAWQACSRAWRVHFRQGRAASAQRTI